MGFLRRWEQFRGRWWSGYLFALCLVGLLTLLFTLVQFQAAAATASMIFLLAVLAIAINFGAGPAVLTSLLAFAALSAVFVPSSENPPRYDPREVLVLYTFLVASFAIGQLTATHRQRDAEVRQREREATLLYELSRTLLGADLPTATQTLATRLSAELDLAAVAVDVDAGPLLKEHVSLGDAALLSGPTLAAPADPPRGLAGLWWAFYLWLLGRADTGRGDLGWRLSAELTDSDERVLGSITVARDATSPALDAAAVRLLASVGTQLSMVCERERLRRESMETEILRRSDDLKTALLRAVSHDLRTPLASILAAAGSLREDAGWTVEETAELADTIAVGAGRLNAIVENLLDLSRLESGSLEPRKDWYELWVLVDDVLAKLRPATGQHVVVVDVPDDLPLLALDYVQISQVLINLIENAVHYSPPGTEVKVAARVRGDEVEIVVADRGPGLPDVPMELLFKPFYRGDGQWRRPQGAGLGLAVVKGLVQAHDGRVWAEQRAEGGARFVFALPVTQPADAPAFKEEVEV